MIIADRSTMEADLHLHRYDDDTVLMVLKQNAFVTTLLFEKCAEEIFFPTIEGKRGRRDYQGPCVLFLPRWDFITAIHSSGSLKIGMLVRSFWPLTAAIRANRWIG
jgi:hypothetical protein